MTTSSGSKGFYQAWADQVGDQSYKFENILAYFKKSPSFTPPNDAKRGPNSNISFDASAFSQNAGPLQVSYPNYYQPFSKYIKQAFRILGLKEIAGLNSGRLLGFSEFTWTVDPKSGIRSSSETSFLQSAIDSSALQVYQQTLAQQVLFDGQKAATGVSVVTAGKKYVISASKEVIIAAGVVSHRFVLHFSASPLAL